jgi:hypothetical protein
MSQDIKLPPRSATSCRHRLRGMTLLLGLPMCLFLNTGDGGRQKAPQGSAVRPILVADPNPVPAGDLDQPVGTTTITWDTGNGAIGDLYVKVDRQPEKFITRRPKGREEVCWIQFDSFYEFRLYTKKRSKRLAKLGVTRDN